MDFEELLGALFVLYILGSMVSGFLRRGRPAGRSSEDGKGVGPGRPRFPQVLDMEELERRLRDLAEGRPTERGGAEEPPAKPARPRPTASIPDIAPAPEAPTFRTETVRVPAVFPTDSEIDRWQDDDWDDVERDESWARSKSPSERPGAKGPAPLPPSVAAFMEQGNPWQAAFVVKEVLGPPRALSPHRGRPRF